MQAQCLLRNMRCYAYEIWSTCHALVERSVKSTTTVKFFFFDIAHSWKTIFFHRCMMCVAQVSCACNESEPSAWPHIELLHLVKLLL